MKFKTLRTSQTGQKFEAVFEKMEKANHEILPVLKQLGVESYSRYRHFAAGGIFAVKFEEGTIPDPKKWRKVEYGYKPRQNTKEGKKLYSLLESLPSVSRNELNQCVGFDGYPFKNIGVNNAHPVFFLFELGDNWQFTPPSDCQEITVAEYNELENTACRIITD